MQIIWSRAAQARSSCKCSSCLHNAVALARRGTSAAVRKRKVTVGEFVTACYSSILASAAIVDARLKSDRRRDWDRAIEEIKAGRPVEDLKVPKTTEGNRKHDVEHETIAEVGLEVDNEGQAAAKSGVYNRSWDKTVWTTTPARQYTKFDTTLRTMNCQLRDRRASISGNGPARKNVEAVINEDEIIRQTNFEHREPNKPEYLLKTQDMMRRLVDQLLYGTNLLALENNTALPNVQVARQRMETIQRIRMVRSQFVSSPNYQSVEHSEVEHERSALHKSLTHLSSKIMPGSDGIDVMVGKLCYNLLVSTAPPSIATYNILIGEFSRLGQHHLVQSVVDSFLHDSKLKPNERTIKLILDHYIAKGDPTGFRAIVRRMRAVEGDMRIKRSTIFALAEDINIQKWALSNKVIHRGLFLSQKVDRDSDIFEALTRGSLGMTGPASAVRFIRAALREGQMVFSQTIFRVVEYCVMNRDYKSGIKLLDAILSFWEDGRTRSPINYTPDVRYALYRLFALCGIDPSANLNQSLHKMLSQEALRSLVRHMQLESLSDSLDYAATRISAVKTLVDFTPEPSDLATKQDSAPRDDASEGVQKAIKTLKKHAKTEKWRAASHELRLMQTRWIRFMGIEARLTTRAKWIASAAEESDLTIELYSRLSEKSKREFVALCLVKSSTAGHLNRLNLLSRLEKRDEEINARLLPRWHSVKGLEVSTESEAMLKKLILKTSPSPPPPLAEAAS
ncbi:hypothetical protein BJ875DRAFT_478233 [Amylocarpus encephaloides]|uniref:Pentatricopeptide repeat domain-containing protein n=1 Tax=Amylocarpus encephaloides TaxID=45428 RepID=A0A9P7Y696_9HELO|nr:hypothetical protein BJ875DRAFT_478233 [Amylocarpus encephaloides]